MFKALRTLGTHENYAAILEEIYTGAVARIYMVDQVLEEEITILNGVRQGDQLSQDYSQKQFRSFFVFVFVFNVQLKEDGINKGGGKLSHLKLGSAVISKNRRHQRYITLLTHCGRRKRKD